jgi:hypothetical protein
MRWLAALALIAACGGGKQAPGPDAGNASLVLDVPDGALAPQGYTSVEIVLHEPTGDVTRTASVDSNGNFNLDRIDPSNSVSVEATLRNASGAAVGYGRTAVSSALAAGAQITVPVRRPIAYIAGTVSFPAPPPNTNPAVLRWTEAPATYSDLSSGTVVDGRAIVPGANAVMVVGAGPNLYLITQATMDPSGALTGPALIMPIAATDHALGAALAGTMTGAVIDAAGSDDGAALVIGTTTELFGVDTASGGSRVLADGNFARVAIVAGDGGELDAVAIRNRPPTTAATCAATAELWWVPLTAGAGPAHMVATGGFADVAADRGHAYYVDACKAELGEVTPAAARTLRGLTAAGIPAGRPTALAVSDGQAFVGLEIPTATPPASLALLVGSLAGSDPPRTLWTEAAQQVMQVDGIPEIQRLLSAGSIAFNQLEIAAGGDYVALTTTAQFHGAEIDNAGFPDTTITSDELRVFSAATGGAVQRYRSWCHGVTIPMSQFGNDFPKWRCAPAAGQSVPGDVPFEHHIGSMTFLFGKK